MNFISSRRLVFAALVALLLTGTGVANLRAEESAEDAMNAMLREPNLAPELTGPEVAEILRPWLVLLKKGWDEKWSEGFTEAFLSVRRLYCPLLPRAQKMTLYSLLPVGRKDVRRHYPERADELERLPTFHGYPILGSLAITDQDVAGRWSEFLNDQLSPGPPSTDCDFMPRHGFRLTMDGRDSDLVVCFECGRVLGYGLPKPKEEAKVPPMFSAAVRLLVNHLFDKNKIERDKPMSETAKGP